MLNSCTADTRLLFTKDGRAYSVMLSALHASTLALFDSLDVDQMTIGALRLNLLNDEPGTDGILTMAVKPLVEAGFLRMLTADGLSETKEFKVSLPFHYFVPIGLYVGLLHMLHYNVIFMMYLIKRRSLYPKFIKNTN